MPSLFKETKELASQIDDFLDAISEGALVFQQGVMDYLSGDMEAFERRFHAIDTLENRADDLRRTVEGHLYRQSLIPESRGDVLGLLETMDDVINTAKHTLSFFLGNIPAWCVVVRCFVIAYVPAAANLPYCSNKNLDELHAGLFAHYLRT